jgi:hypothetical protein
MGTLFSRLGSKVMVGLGAGGVLATVLIPGLQDLIGYFVMSHPKWAPVLGFLALVFAGFTPSASKKIGQATVVEDVASSSTPNRDAKRVTSQVSIAAAKSVEKE